MIVALCLFFCATWACGTAAIISGVSGAAAWREGRIRGALLRTACCLCLSLLTFLGTLVLLEAVR